MKRLPEVIPPPVRKHLPWLVVVALIVVAAIGWGTSGFVTIFQANVPNCGLQAAAFCDPLNNPTANGPDVRSGDLNGLVWGVSRATTHDDPFQGSFYSWHPSTATICGVTSTFNANNDIKICNGGLWETNNDGGAFNILAMYPRQPFDIAGRTGIVAFDLSSDGLCSHCAWPNFVYTDQPVPGPGNGSFGARNSFGFSLWSVGVCPTGQSGVGQAWITQNYVTSFVPLGNSGCVTEGVAGGPLNHFEVRISQSHTEVWATDAGATTLKQIASGNFTIPLTRGLVWMEDNHYNAAKDSNQQTHTFEWANFGFDGPVLPRDLGFDVQNNVVNTQTDQSLGYRCQSACTLSINNVTGLTAAQAALVEFNWTPHNVSTFTYSFNGNPAHTQAWPYPDQQTFSNRTLAMSVPLSELKLGTNSFQIDYAGDVWDIANVDLILVGAGGGGSVPPTSAPTLAPTQTLVPTLTLAPTAGPPTPVPAVATSTSVPATPVPAVIPTDTPIVPATATTAPLATSTALPPPPPTRAPLICSLSVGSDGTVTGACVSQ